MNVNEEGCLPGKHWQALFAFSGQKDEKNKVEAMPMHRGGAKIMASPETGYHGYFHCKAHGRHKGEAFYTSLNFRFAYNEPTPRDS